MIFRLTAILLLCSFLYGCATEKKPKRLPPTKPRALICQDSERLLLNIYGPEDATLSKGSKSYTLKRKETASGVLYANKDVSVWNKGLEYMVSVKDETKSCSPAPEAIF